MKYSCYIVQGFLNKNQNHRGWVKLKNIFFPPYSG